MVRDPAAVVRGWCPGPDEAKASSQPKWRGGTELNTRQFGKWKRIGFYGLIGYTAFSTTLAWSIQLGVIPSSPRTAEAEATSEKKAEIPSNQLSAQTFATNFAREYLLWTKEKEDSRKERLEPYLHPELDPQAGLDMSKVEWDSWAREVEVWDLKPLGKGKWEALIYAQLQMSQGKKQKRVDRWMKIPMEKAGESFLVIAPPYFVTEPKTASPSETEADEKKGDAVDSVVQEDVETFLNSFWKTYTTGKPEEIRYLMKGEGETEGLTGILAFLEMKDLSVYQEGESYRAECTVLFQDLASGAEVTYPYTLYLAQEGMRWYVMQIEQNERH